MSLGEYVLIGQTAVPAHSLLEWAEWMETADRRVGFTRVLDICEVSTVFLGLDHGFWCAGPPVLYESMAFWKDEGGWEQARCSTWEEAEAMHQRMVAEVARPAAVLAALGRRWRVWWSEASEDWREHWRDLQGKPATELERMSRQLRERMGNG